MTDEKYSIFRVDELPSIDRGNGARTIPLVSKKTGSENFLNGMTIFEPGARIAHHLHNVAESVMVIKGNAIVNVNGVEHHLKTFDTTFVPGGIPHHFQNASQTEEMRIFWTYGSLDATRTIVETGVTVRIDEEQSR
jgi:quercetin dioxygenase-like cupin family protein